MSESNTTPHPEPRDQVKPEQTRRRFPRRNRDRAQDAPAPDAAPPAQPALPDIGGSKQSAYLNPDRPWVGLSAVGLIVLVMGAAMVFSFAAITEAAAWTGNAVAVRPFAAIMIDGALIAFAVVRAVLLWRRVPAGRTLVFQWLFTGISVLVNFAHAASSNNWDFARWETWAGCLIAVSAPVAAVLTAEEIIRMVFRQHVDPEQEAAEFIRLAELQVAVNAAYSAALASAPTPSAAAPDPLPTETPAPAETSVPERPATPTSDTPPEPEPAPEPEPEYAPEPAPEYSGIIQPASGSWDDIQAPRSDEFELYGLGSPYAR